MFSQQHCEDPYYPTINEVVHRVTEELKQILKKDFNKKMIENTAFKHFEMWWDEQLRGKPEAEKSSLNSKSERRETNQIPVANSISVPNIPLQDISNKKEDKMDSFKSILDSNRDLGLDLGGYGLTVGLGLRATIPKMPSFRKKRMIPSPVVMDEDSSNKRLSDQVIT